MYTPFEKYSKYNLIQGNRIFENKRQNVNLMEKF